MSRPTELRLESDLAAWREGVRSFLGAEMDPARTAGHVDPTDLTGLDEEFERAHHRAAAARGFLAIALPAADGGGGRPRSWKQVYDLGRYLGVPDSQAARTTIGKPEVGMVASRARDRAVSGKCRIEKQVSAEIDLLRREAITGSWQAGPRPAYARIAQ